MNINSKSSASTNESVKLALAISLLRSKLSLNQNQSTQPSESDALRWKRKAKERKQELVRLREDLREAEESAHYDLFPQSASCKCYFFDNLGKLSSEIDGNDSHRRFNDVLRRRFLRQVRLKERRRTGDSTQRRRLSELSYEDEAEQLRASVDFLVELCDTVSPAKEGNFASWSHQAVDFILVFCPEESLRNLLSEGKRNEAIEGIITSLIVRLVKRMCSPLKEDDSLHIHDESQFGIQHLIRKLASEAYIGQRVIFSVSQIISVVAENLLFSDPFDAAFPSMHQSMFLMIQLIEFLISDYLSTWSSGERFDNRCVKSTLQARKAAQLLESRNGLYVLYMDRVTGLLAKQVGQVSSLHKLNPDVLEKLFF
ncbi:protein MULTIPOLAR SPINDLE 1 isoform X2 [Mangifera indica]|uniref:protein MULTIPOLAR SPINDLE 1 isoform X2 n=1 Tax=Mangifera indica TaxID=29780 RepID=UPI001CFAF94D|nr:protein MULTIPOLAR SPINDLE 1 isoform X2 [Mangifera indica]